MHGHTGYFDARTGYESTAQRTSSEYSSVFEPDCPDRSSRPWRSCSGGISEFTDACRNRGSEEHGAHRSYLLEVGQLPGADGLRARDCQEGITAAVAGWCEQGDARRDAIARRSQHLHRRRPQHQQIAVLKVRPPTSCPHPPPHTHSLTHSKPHPDTSAPSSRAPSTHLAKRPRPPVSRPRSSRTKRPASSPSKPGR